MKSKYSHPKFENLSDENIESAVKTADQFFRENGIEVEHISQCCPMLESILRAYQKKDENVPFRLLFWRSWKKIKVSVLLKSESFNILEEEKDTFSPEQIPEPYRPDWKYKGKRNRVTFHLPVKTPDLNSLKYVLRYMDTEKGAFRQGVVMRFLNMITLVLEPWMAAKLIHPDVRFIFPTTSPQTSSSLAPQFRELALANPSFTEAELNSALGIEGKSSLIAVA